MFPHDGHSELILYIVVLWSKLPRLYFLMLHYLMVIYDNIILHVQSEINTN